MVEASEYPSIRMALSEAWLAGVKARRSGGPREVPQELQRQPVLLREWEAGWEDGVPLPRQPPGGLHG